MFTPPLGNPESVRSFGSSSHTKKELSDAESENLAHIEQLKTTYPGFFYEGTDYEGHTVLLSRCHAGVVIKKHSLFHGADAVSACVLCSKAGMFALCYSPCQIWSSVIITPISSFFARCMEHNLANLGYLANKVAGGDDPSLESGRVFPIAGVFIESHQLGQEGKSSDVTPFEATNWLEQIYGKDAVDGIV